MNNPKLSLLDREQIAIRIFDEDVDAQRVIIVGGDGNQIAASIKEGLKDLKFETPQTTIQIIEIPKIITEYKEIEKLLPIVEYKIIEKPIFIKEMQIVEIPMVIKELQIIEVPIIVEKFPQALKWLFLVQVFMNLVILFFRK